MKITIVCLFLVVCAFAQAFGDPNVVEEWEGSRQPTDGPAIGQSGQPPAVGATKPRGVKAGHSHAPGAHTRKFKKHFSNTTGAKGLGLKRKKGAKSGVTAGVTAGAAAAGSTTGAGKA